MKRPVGITIVGILILLSGVIFVVTGLLSLIGYAGGTELGNAMLPLTVILTVFGLIYLLVAKGIFSGSNLARLIVGLVTVLALIGVVIQLFSTDNKLGSVVGIVIDVVILWILFGTKGREFFTQR